MQRGDKLIIIRDADTDPRASRTTAMIAALSALGIPLDTDCPYQETRELIERREQRVVTWVLKPSSVCGRFETQDMLKAWADAGFVRANPEHPFAYIKQAFENHAHIVESVTTQAPLALIRKGKRIALIPFDATPERREQLLAELDA
jgi:hypothetical protein